MASLLTVNSNPNVYYKAPQNTTLNEKSSVAEQTTTIPENNSNDSFSSNEAGINTESDIEEKDSIGKKFVRFIGGVVIVAAALFTAYKWKGDKWLNPEAQGFGAKIKNWLMKPGEYMEKGFNKLRGKGNAKTEGDGSKPAETSTGTPGKGNTNPESEIVQKTKNKGNVNPEGDRLKAIEDFEKRIQANPNIKLHSEPGIGDPIPLIEFRSVYKVDKIDDEEMVKFIDHCKAEGINIESDISITLSKLSPESNKVQGRDANYLIGIDGRNADGIHPIVRCLYKAKSVSENIEKELNSITERYIMNIK